MRILLPSFAFLMFFSAVCGISANANGSETDFVADVYRVLEKNCFECHGPKRQEGDLRLDRQEDVVASGVTGADAGDTSELLNRITLQRGHELAMPAVGEPLSAAEISSIRQWISSGAKWPDNFQRPAHWAFVAPTQQPLPKPDAKWKAWPRGPMDHFVLKRMLAAGLAPSPEAEPAALLRRVYLDLIGIPPSPQETTAFLRDIEKRSLDKAYARVVDDLLKRPQFGERWARHWLDLARYADSHGFQRDNLREIWAFRDWVIRAMNDDMPFDQFTIEQLAGDLLPDATESQRIATGFHRCTTTNVEAGSLPEETRTEQVVDRVNTTAAVWLGVTMECAQCHDHKYDPFSAKEYYQLLAFFNNTELEADRADPKKPSSIKFLGPSMTIRDGQTDPKRKTLTQLLADAQQEQAARRQQLNKDLEAWAVERLAQQSETPFEHELNVVAFRSLGKNDTHRILDDQSILLEGKNPPAKDSYTVTLKLPSTPVTAIKVEALTHESLPGKGPGRGDPVRRNFILSEITATADGKPIAFLSATADFSQARWDVSQAIDGDRKKGWAIAPQFGKPHWAMFVLESPVSAKQIQLTIHQDYGSARTIGRLRVLGITGNPNKVPLSSDLAALLMQANDPERSEKWTKAQRNQVLAHRVETDGEANRLKKRVAELTNELKSLPEKTTLVMVELDKRRETRMYVRGDYRNLGDVVNPGAPAVLHAMPQGAQTRLDLARWIVDPKNPLTARVVVNRWWAELFGVGIVSTLEDFGVKGEWPTHPEVLDHLAVELVEKGWSMKRLLRSIVLSATYRQSSVISSRLRKTDPDNRWLSRGPGFRMDAEMIRDNALTAAGLISLKQFGPSIRPYQPAGIWSKVGGTAYSYKTSPGAERFRRGIYVVLKRGAPYPSFINFDGSPRLACSVKRSRTNTPLQALTLLNDPVYVEAAKGLAARMVSECESADIDARLRFGFACCVTRQPTDKELSVLRGLYDSQLAEAEANAEKAHAIAKESPQGSSPNGITPSEFAAYYHVATAMLNLHETITKP